MTAYEHTWDIRDAYGCQYFAVCGNDVPPAPTVLTFRPRAGVMYRQLDCTCLRAQPSARHAYSGRGTAEGRAQWPPTAS